MFRFRSTRNSVFFFVFIFAFLPLSIHWDSLRLIFQEWLSLIRGDNSLSSAAQKSLRLLADTSSQTPAFITIHRVTATTPTCSITAPTDGATVSGASTSVTANATSTKSILNVQFLLDGASLGSPDTSSPYGITWDTTGVGNGTHSLSCIASNQFSGAGDPAISVTVNNDSTPPTRSSGAPSTYLPSGTTQTDISLLTDENATCKYSTTIDTAYASMEGTFTTTGTTTHNTTVTGLTDNGSYTYYVRCQDGAGNPNIDDFTISFSVLNPSSDVTAPSTPQNLASTTITMSAITLTWDASTDNVGVAGYKVFRDSVQIATTTDTTYTDNTSLSPSTTYSYEIAAYDAAANTSVHSSIITPSTIADSEAPTAPANLTATATSNTTIGLTWDAATDNIGVTGYKVFRDSAQIGTTIGTTYNDANLAALTSYTYTVSAYDAADLSSELSAPATTTTSATPAVAAWEEEKKKVVKKANRVLKQSASVVTRGEILTQSGRRFSKNAVVRLYFQRQGSLYYAPLIVTTNKKGEFSVSYKVNKWPGTYNWYAVEVNTGRKSKKRTYTVYDPKKTAKPTVKKSSSSSSSTSTHSS